MSQWQIVTPRRIPLREVWPHEQYDFSAWVKANAGFLSDHLGVTIDEESLDPEVATGAFSADLVGTAIDDRTGEELKIVIENQLARTDHDHLGKVLTYTAHHEADVAVWIAGEVRSEHVKAVQWLNDRVDGFRVWLFQVDAVAVSDEHVAPMLRQVVGPSVLSEAVKLERRVDDSARQGKLDFWSAVLPHVRDACADTGIWAKVNPYASVHLWQTAPVSLGMSRLGYQLWVTSATSWMCLRVDDEDPDQIAAVWEALLADQAGITDRFGEPLQWVASDTARNRQLRWDNPVPGGYRDPPEDPDAAGRSLGDGMARLIAATLPVLHTVRRAVPTDPTNPEA